MTGPAEQAARAPRGRPVATSHARIEQVAFRLFAERGFEGTTLATIADAVGVGRRTLFRYYTSKNDIPWGQFDRTLQGFREILDATDPDLPLHEAVHHGVVAFNSFPDDARPTHRDRMRLILQTPALQAHSALRYAEWRQVIADFVARRTGARADDLAPQLVGHVSLGLALTAYEAWLEDEGAAIADLLHAAMAALGDYLGSPAAR